MFWKTPTVTIRGNKFDAYQLDAYWKGMEDEQDRIIKLLEADCERPLDPKWEHYRESCNCYQIELIKGENK